MVGVHCFRQDLKKKSKEEVPLFNLSISLDGWQGPFKDFRYFLGIASIAEDYSDLVGNRYVTSNGELRHGKLENLHTFEAEMDLSQKGHLHYGKRGILSLNGSTKVDQRDLPLHPLYTLTGLYETIHKNYRWMVKPRIERLTEEFLLRGKEVESIAKYPKTILALLENKYRKEISDQ